MPRRSEEDLHRISFAFSKQGLIGSGLVPVGTSLAQAAPEYQQLNRWNEALKMRVAPELPSTHRRPSHWYRRYDDGQGALLRRIPEPAAADGRADRGQAVVGPRLNLPVALLAALGAWQDPHTWLNSERASDVGWQALSAYRRSDVEVLVEAAAELDREAAAQEGLVLLVSAMLRDPDRPVDIFVSEGGPLEQERSRLLLLWGVYATLRDVLGTEERPADGSNDWSFSTYEPWPVQRRSDAHQPRFAFRPPLEGTRPEPAQVLEFTGNEYRSGGHHVIAEWLVSQLGREGRGELDRVRQRSEQIRARSEEIGDGRHDTLVADLFELAEAGGRSRKAGKRRRQDPPRTPDTTVRERPEPPSVAESEVADPKGLAEARERAEEFDSDLARALSDEQGVSGRGSRGGSRPGEDRSGQVGPGYHGQYRSPEDVSPGRRPGEKASPGAGTPGSGPVSGPRSVRTPDVPGSGPRPTRLDQLLEELARQHDPGEIGRLATQIVQEKKPEFTRSLAVRTPLSAPIGVPRWFLLLLVLQPLLICALLLIAL